MTTPAITRNLDNFHLDILGQNPRINRLYTQITFCFPVPDESYSQEIISILTRGMERLSTNFEWMAGKVVLDADAIFKIKPFERNPRLTVKDYRQDRSIQDWNVYRRAKFPFSMLDETIIAPCKTLAFREEVASELSVFLIQANFVTGGLLLTFNGQHGAMDMTGQAQVTRLLAKACRNEAFIPSELQIGNMDRKNLIPLLDDAMQDPNVDCSMRNSADEERTQPPLETQTQSPPTCTWAYFSFPRTSLSALKSLALSTVPPDRFVSTDDALSAFIWQSVTRARRPRFGTTSTPDSTLSRNVDARRYFSIPSAYAGFVTTDTVHTCSFATLAREPLGTIATRLRSALDPATLRQRLRTEATRLSRKGDREKKNSVAASVPGQDVRLSSWAKEDCYELDFGFGQPEAVRRPRFTDGAREGLVYFLPRTPDGEIVVGISLREEDLELLKSDEVFRRYGKFVG